MKLDFTSYDKSDIFHAEMKPLIDKLQAIAIEHKIGFVCLAQYMIDDQKDSVAFGMAKTIALHGKELTNPALVTAATAVDNPKAALAACMLSIALDGGTQPDNRQEMLKDGTDAELDGAKDAVDALLGHARH